MCDCICWANLTWTYMYEVLKKKAHDFNNILPKTVRFDNSIRHFDASKSHNRPLTPLIIGIGVRRFDRICALLQRFQPCQKVVF